MSDRPDDIWWESPEQQPVGIPANPYVPGFDNPDPVVKPLAQSYPWRDRMGELIGQSSFYDDKTQTLTFKPWTMPRMEAMQGAITTARQSGKVVKSFCVWLRRGELADPNVMTRFVRWGFRKDSLAGNVVTFTKDLSRKPRVEPQPSQAKPPVKSEEKKRPMSHWKTELTRVQKSVQHTRDCGIFPSEKDLSYLRWLTVQVQSEKERQASPSPEVLEIERQEREIQKQIEALQSPSTKIEFRTSVIACPHYPPQASDSTYGDGQ